jgi:nitrite reductase (NO-forming)
MWSIQSRCMNKLFLSTLVAGVLIAGLLFGPILSGKSAFQAQAQVPPTGKTKKVTFIAEEKVLQIAPDDALHPGGIMYNAMVFNGTIPGPLIAVDQGDDLQFTLINRGTQIHSIDFHAGFGTNQANSGPLKPGENKTWTIHAVYPGAFFYHCSADALMGIWEHIANGMYGGIVVHPQNEKPAKEFYMVFGENYNTADQGLFKGTNGKTGSFNLTKFLANDPDLILTNGMAHKYVPAIGTSPKLEINKNAQVFKVKPGELTRWYIFDGGPNQGVSFHFIGGIIDVHDGAVKNRYGTQALNEETWWIPVGSGSVIESTFPEEGLYVGVGHAMNNVLKGGAFAVLAAANSTATDHPTGTWVPPKGSETAAGGNATTTAIPGGGTTPSGVNATTASTQKAGP